METKERSEPKLLYRRLDALFGAIDPSRSAREVMTAFAARAFETLRDDLRLRGAILWGEGRDGFEHVHSAGRAGAVADTAEGVPPSLALVLQHRVYIFADPAAEDHPSRHGLAPPLPVAGVAVGTRPARHVALFVLAEGWVREEVDFALNTVGAALGTRLMEERVRLGFREAAEIQQSLLVEEPPPFPGYELAARSVPAEEVGGDFYDFHPFGGDLMGLAIGDASGHGLPAALLVRDVVTGLRVGLEKHLRIAYVMEKLNRVIHRSALSSRFVSVFYGELEATGSLIYVNAGHPPPLIFSGERVVALDIGGTVVGPLPDTRFRRGVAHLAPGDVLVMCTDGILERRGRGGEFGPEGLRAVVAQNRGTSAEALLGALFDTAAAFGGGRPWEDDASALVVRRLAR